MKTLNECATLITNPWNHYHIKNIFKSETLDALLKLIDCIEYTHLSDTDTVKFSDVNHKKSRNSFPLLKKYKIPIVDYIINSFISKENLSFCEENDNRFKSANKIAKITLLKDFPGVVLPIHTDAEYKLLTMQIYLPRNNEKNYGTSFYDENKNLVYTNKYELNAGYMFFPNYNSTKTYHAYNQPIITERSSILLNIIDKNLFIKKYSYASLLNCINID